MRILAVTILLAAACGGPKAKSESSMVNEGSDLPPTCCCKTIPASAEKEIVPVFVMEGRMECSTKQGECVDDIQCNGAHPADTGSTGPTDNGVPALPPTTTTGAGDAIPH